MAKIAKGQSPPHLFMSDKPKPLKVFGRTHYACTRCKLSKIKCLGEKPACANCKLVGKENHCVYPTRDRKIVIMESDLNKLHARVHHLEELVKNQGPFPEHLPHSDSMVQHRVINVGTSILESYLLPDVENEFVPHALLLLCRHQLPEQAYAWRLIDRVLQTYSSEFYLIDPDELRPLVTRIYDYFGRADVRGARGKPVPAIALCYFFVILAFGEQMHNMTLDVLPPAITAVTGGVLRVPGVEYYSTAAKLFNLTHEEIDVQFIQSALLLALFACNLNRYNTVYNFFGVAVRLAVANGYHRQMEAAVDDHAHRVRCEKTRRLWWSIFVIDTVWAAKMNMPVHIDYTDTDVALPDESPAVDLGDGFNTEMLASNVHLTKYVAKFNRLIYGPNMRTFSLNYINTDQFNQKLLAKNIVRSLADIVTLFEEPTLARYKAASITAHHNRNVANLFLRYNQLVILVTKPLMSLVFNRASSLNIDNADDVVRALSRGIAAAARSVEILLKLYEHNKLFVLGFWDSQHLFSALLMLVMSSVTGNAYNHLNRAVALLKHMADNNNINALNSLKKLEQVNCFLGNVPEVSIFLNLNSNITNYVLKRSPSLAQNGNDTFYNPFVNEVDMPRLAPPTMLTSLFERFGLSELSDNSQAVLSSMIKAIQSWDNFRGLPIHIYGTEGLDKQIVCNTRQVSKNFKIDSLI